MRIILIDDELDEASSRVDTLRQFGFEIIVVNKASDVIKTLEKSRENISAIILDIMMPPEGYADLKDSRGGTFTGVLLLKDIRRILGNIPVVVVTAHSTEDVREKLPGVDLIIEKPVDSAEVAKKVSDVIKKKQTGSAQ